MKRILSLLLVLSLFLPVLSLAELEEEDFSADELEEEILLDDEEEESAPESASAEPLSEELKSELLGSLESADYVPTELDTNNLYINGNLPDNVTNILLIGVDTRNAELEENDIKLADVQMILSIDTEAGTVKLSSILRDTLVTNPFTGNLKPINESYQSYDSKNIFHDNPQRSVATVNYNFEMNIQYYVTINFRGVVAIIDQVGGIDVDLTEGEAWNINRYLKKNAKKISRHYDTPEAKAARVELEERDGVQHLDGLQALMYARLRKSLSNKYKMGDDWQRTARTRHLLDLLLQKVLKKDVMDQLDLISTGIEYVNSNMNVDFMGSLVFKLLGSGIVGKVGSSESIIEQFRIPMGSAEDGTRTWATDADTGKIFMSRRNGNFQKNIEALHAFIYGEGKYYPANRE